MSYPKNKRDRFLIGKRKGYKRVSLFFHDFDSVEKEERIRKINSQRFIEILRRNVLIHFVVIPGDGEN